CSVMVAMTRSLPPQGGYTCPCHTPTILFDSGHMGVQDAVLEDGKMAATCTAQQHAEILRLAQEVGPLEAAKRQGMPPGAVTG
ncbi:MAG TPA: hypothetical protein PKL73_10110, partial [Polyangiaceae bacterium]|nr:hypothetical protein [Polyangiaceae bacterium]